MHSFMEQKTTFNTTFKLEGEIYEENLVNNKCV